MITLTGKYYPKNRRYKIRLGEENVGFTRHVFQWDTEKNSLTPPHFKIQLNGVASICLAHLCFTLPDQPEIILT